MRTGSGHGAKAGVARGGAAERAGAEERARVVDSLRQRPRESQWEGQREGQRRPPSPHPAAKRARAG